MEPAFRSNQDFYDYVDGTIAELRASGCDKEADRLDHLLHKVAWTTSSELFGELGLALIQISAQSQLNAAARAKVENCIAGVRLVWPDIGRDPRGL